MSGCPRCHEPLVTYELEGVEVDRCLECGGTWLDEGELQMLLELAGAGTGRLSEALEAAARVGARGKLRCPRCAKRMDVIHLGEAEAVELDRCRNAHGLWFDAREVEAVVRKFHEGDEGVVARYFAELYRYELGAPSKEE